MSLLSLVIFSLVFAEWYAKHDFKVYTQGFILDHTSRLIIRGCVLVPLSVLSAWWFDRGLQPIPSILFTGLSCSIFWLWFELRFNYMLDDDDPFYIGNTAWSDRALRKLKISGLQLFYIKVFMIIFLAIANLVNFLVK